MSYKSATGKSITEAFNDFDEANPNVYKKFVELAFEAIKKGKQKLSFKLMLNRIRWDIYMEIEKTDLFSDPKTGKSYKINDAFHSRYARKFVADYPDHADKVELRELRSE